jgi:hypothetical protein
MTNPTNCKKESKNSYIDGGRPPMLPPTVPFLGVRPSLPVPVPFLGVRPKLNVPTPVFTKPSVPTPLPSMITPPIATPKPVFDDTILGERFSTVYVGNIEQSVDDDIIFRVLMVSW